MNTTTTFSPAETRVLGELLRGGQVKEIADRLCISYHTANRHIANMSEKVGVHSLHELVAYAWSKATDITIEEVCRKVGTMCLLALFSTYTFCGDCDDIVRRAGRRTRRRHEIEIIE
jgi:DNA-binding CsgD family transcriptional regulator